MHYGLIKLCINFMHLVKWPLDDYYFWASIFMEDKFYDKILWYCGQKKKGLMFYVFSTKIWFWRLQRCFFMVIFGENNTTSGYKVLHMCFFLCHFQIWNQNINIFAYSFLITFFKFQWQIFLLWLSFFLFNGLFLNQNLILNKKAFL